MLVSTQKLTRQDGRKGVEKGIWLMLQTHASSSSCSGFSFLPHLPCRSVAILGHERWPLEIDSRWGGWGLLRIQLLGDSLALFSSARKLVSVNDQFRPSLLLYLNTQIVSWRGLVKGTKARQKQVTDLFNIMDLLFRHTIMSLDFYQNCPVAIFE